MHEVIDKFFKRVKEQNLELGNLMAEEEIVVKIVDSIVEDELQNANNYRFKETVKYKILVIRLKKIIVKA